MARAGHSAAQMPQPMHLAASICPLPSLLQYGAEYGQTVTQVMQEMHFCWSTYETWALTSSCVLDSTVAARAAAARACEMFSSMNFGEWARPQRKMPSVAKSTGRSFMWAST